MIIKILSSASIDFHGVKYNDKKVVDGAGELMKMENFPSFINKDSNQEEVRDYLKSISQSASGRVKKPQFHAVISTKYQQHSKEELTKIAEEVMKEMGYGQQPYIIVFHNDTDNNHVHIVSSRVNKTTGKKIEDAFEKLKSQRALSNVMEKLYGVQVERNIDVLLEYNYSSIKQLETLLQRNGFKLITNATDSNQLDILKNGVRKSSLKKTDLNFKKSDIQRKRQLRAIFYKYKDLYSNQVFRVEDDRKRNGKIDENTNEAAKIIVEFESELQHNFRRVFGVDIVFHSKDGKDPFGYSIIDHKTGCVFKGSEVMKMQDLFDFSDDSIDKKTFEKLKFWNVSNEAEKKCLLKFYNERNIDVKDFMVFKNRTRKNIEDYKTVKSQLINYIKTPKYDENISVIAQDGKYYAIHSQYNHIQELESLVGKNMYQAYINNKPTEELTENKYKGRSNSFVDDWIKVLGQSEFGKTDPSEKERKRRKKKKR